MKVNVISARQWTEPVRTEAVALLLAVNDTIMIYFLCFFIIFFSDYSNKRGKKLNHNNLMEIDTVSGSEIHLNVKYFSY